MRAADRAPAGALRSRPLWQAAGWAFLAALTALGGQALALWIVLPFDALPMPGLLPAW